jgi:arylsulfatase A-like enzyme
LGSFDHMPKVKKLLQEEGMTFRNAFVHTPICCPSRSFILTGRYLHNAVATSPYWLSEKFSP